MSSSPQASQQDNQESDLWYCPAQLFFFHCLWPKDFHSRSLTCWAQAQKILFWRSTGTCRVWWPIVSIVVIWNLANQFCLSFQKIWLLMKFEWESGSSSTFSLIVPYSCHCLQMQSSASMAFAKASFTAFVDLNKVMMEQQNWPCGQQLPGHFKNFGMSCGLSWGTQERSAECIAMVQKGATNTHPILKGKWPILDDPLSGEWLTWTRFAVWKVPKSQRSFLVIRLC